MAKVKKRYVIYYESSGLKHYFQHDIENGPSVICLGVKDAKEFSYIEAKTELMKRGRKWKKELIAH